MLFLAECIRIFTTWQAIPFKRKFYFTCFCQRWKIFTLLPSISVCLCCETCRQKNSQNWQMCWKWWVKQISSGIVLRWLTATDTWETVEIIFMHPFIGAVIVTIPVKTPWNTVSHVCLLLHYFNDEFHMYEPASVIHVRCFNVSASIIRQMYWIQDAWTWKHMYERKESIFIHFADLSILSSVLYQLAN